MIGVECDHRSGEMNEGGGYPPMKIEKRIGGARKLLQLCVAHRTARLAARGEAA
jgi:hypothetical protein